MILQCDTASGKKTNKSGPNIEPRGHITAQSTGIGEKGLLPHYLSSVTEVVLKPD